MRLYCGLENEDYKSVYGVQVKGTVPFDTQKIIAPIVGRNDWAVVNLLLFSQDEMMVTTSKETSFYYKGPIDQVRVEIDCEEQENIDINYSLVGMVRDDDNQFKADIILDKKSLYVKPRQVQQILIQTKTTKACRPGKYRVKIRIYVKNMFEDELLEQELTFEVRVVDYCLKDAKDYEFYLDLWQHNSNIARKYEVELWSDAHFEILDKYVASLAELGQKAITVVVSEIPWSGQGSVYDNINHSDLFEYSMVKLKLTKEGQWIYDFSAVKRYIELCMSYSIDQEIEVFGLSSIWLYEDFGFGKIIEDDPNGIKLRYYDESDMLFKFIRKKEDLEAYIEALDRFFVDNGWAQKVRILADEPKDLEVFRQKVNRLNEMAPNFKLKVAIDTVSFMGEHIENVVDYCPIISCIDQKYDEFLEMKNCVEGRLSYYVCCHPSYPNSFINSPLIESRFIPWVAKFIGVEGFLRWNYTVWPDDPINELSYKYPLWSAGDMNFVYPGKTGEPQLSLRYMNLKRGIRDYQLMVDYEAMDNSDKYINQRLKEVFYQDGFYKAQMSREQLYSLSYRDYENIIEDCLMKLDKSYRKEEYCNELK